MWKIKMQYENLKLYHLIVWSCSENNSRANKCPFGAPNGCQSQWRRTWGYKQRWFTPKKGRVLTPLFDMSWKARVYICTYMHVSSNIRTLLVGKFENYMEFYSSESHLYMGYVPCLMPPEGKQWNIRQPRSFGFKEEMLSQKNNLHV